MRGAIVRVEGGNEGDSSGTRWGRILFVAALALVASAALFVPAAEDAAILFQYSDHWAQTGVISYVAHGPRVEGATDFLWMAVLALGRWIGVSPHAATGPLNALSLFGLAWVLGEVSGGSRRQKTLLWTPVIFLLTPQMAAAMLGFSVLPFGFLLALLVLAYVKERHRVVAVAALLLCLLRPDGVVFAIPLIGFDLARQRFHAKAWREQALWFLLPAGLYMAWRVHYFGHWFPLPFVVKSHAERWMGYLVVESLADMSRYLSLALLTSALLWRWGILRGATLAIAISTLLVPSVFYLGMRLDQNIADRFFFYLLLIPAMLLCMHGDRLRGWTTLRRVAGAGVLAALFLWPYWFAMVHLATDRYLTNSLVAGELKARGLRGTMAVSEAGILAYETSWPTVDLWGLNTPEYARRLVQPRDVAGLGVDLIVLHYTTCSLPAGWAGPSEKRTWGHMAENVLSGASMSDYEEFRLPYNQSAFGQAARRFTDGETTSLCYFVRRDSAAREGLEGAIVHYGGVRMAGTDVQ